MHTQQFRNSFVTSGTTGGDIGQKPTIVAARVAPAQPVALPPPPVVPAAHVHNAASTATVQAVRVWGPPLRCSGSEMTSMHSIAESMWHAALVQDLKDEAQEVLLWIGQAIAAAQAIAARLSGGPSQPAAAAPNSYAPQSASTASIAAAQAIAARLSGGPSQPAAAAPNSYAPQNAPPPSTQYAGNQWGGVSSGRSTSNSTQPFSYEKLNESALAGRRGYNSNVPPPQSSMPQQQRWGGHNSHASAPAPRSYGQSSHVSAPAPRSFGGRDSGHSRGGGAQPGGSQAGSSASNWAAAIAAMDGDGQGSARDDDRHRSSGSRDHDRRRDSDVADRYGSHGSSRDGARPEKQSDASRRRKWDMP